MSTIKSVSLSDQDAKFLKDNEFSPSILLRGAIEQCRENMKAPDPEVSVSKKLEMAQRRLTDVYDFINQRGLFDDFLEAKRKNKLEE